jgi:hypothetical protein
VGDGDGAGSSADEVDGVTFDILNYHDLFLGEEMEGEVTDRFSQDTLLDEEYVGTGCNDLFDQVEDVLLLFFKKAVHGGVVVNNDAALKVGLGCREGELDKTNSCVFDAGRTSGEMGSLATNENEAIDELRVINGTANLSCDQNVVEVSSDCSFLVNNLQDGIDSNGGEEIRVVGHDL